MSHWEAHIVTRGGAQLVAVLPFTSLSLTRKLDDMGNATVAGINDQDGWAAIGAVTAWEHELVLWRDGSEVFAGPATDVDARTAEGWSTSARDLFQWFERRFVARDRTMSADLAQIFKRVADDAMAADNSPGVSVLATDCGVVGDRVYVAAEYGRAADALRELARTGVDWTFVGRQMLVGGEEVPTSPVATLIDSHVQAGSAQWAGLTVVNDVVTVGGATAATATTAAVDAPVGRATRPPSIAQRGLLQQRFDEPNILDLASANANAASRADLLASVDPTVTVTVTDEIADQFDVLVPGARVDVAFSDQLFPREIVGPFRLLESVTDVGGDGERLTLTLQPPGTPQ